jgi:hypothetical protein
VIKSFLLVALFLGPLFFGNVLNAQVERALPVKVLEARGQVYIFKDLNGPLFVAKPIMLLNHGHFIATGRRSTALLDLTTNGIVILGPQTLVSIGKRSRSGLRHIDVIYGRLYFQTRPEMQQRPPGAIFTLRSSPYGFVGSNFRLTFTEEERSLDALSSDVRRLPLKAIEGVQTRPQQEDDGWDEWDDSGSDDFDDDWGDELEADFDLGAVLTPEALQDQYLARLRQQTQPPERPAPFSVTVQRRPITGRFISRGIYNTEQRSLDTDVTLIVNDLEAEQSLREESSQLNFDKLNYDFRLELNTDRQVRDARLFMSAWVEYGKPTSNYRSPLQIFNTRKEGRGPIELNEFYLTSNFTTTDLSVGKKVYRTGTGLLISQLDRITPKDLYDPLDPKDLGNWMVQLDHYFGNSSFTYLTMPYFLTNKSAFNFIASGVDENTLIAPEQRYPKGELKSFTHYFQFKTIAMGWDLIFGAKYGPNLFPVYTVYVEVDENSTEPGEVFRQEYYKEHANVFNGTFAFSTTTGPFNFYGEYLYQKSPGQRDDDLHAYHLGFKYRNSDFANIFKLDFIDLFIEHSREAVFSRARLIDEEELINEPQNFVGRRNNFRSSSNWRSHPNNYLARLVFQVTDNFNFNSTYDISFKDGSRLAVYGIEYRLREGLNMRFNYESYQIDLDRSDTSSRNLFIGGFTLEGEERTNISAKQTFDRFTLRLEYLF